MVKYHLLVLCLFCLNIAGSYTTYFTDYYFETMKIEYPNSSFFHGNISLRRSGREHPKVFVEVDLTDAISNYEGDVKMYYSPIGNRRYILLPFKVTRMSICEGMQYKAVQDVFQSLQNYSNYSNVPLPSDISDKNIRFCELFTKRHYSVRDLAIDKSIFYQRTLTGRYRLVAFAYQKTKKEVAQVFNSSSIFT